MGEPDTTLVREDKLLRRLIPRDVLSFYRCNHSVRVPITADTSRKKRRDKKGAEGRNLEDHQRFEKAAPAIKTLSALFASPKETGERRGKSDEQRKASTLPPPSRTALQDGAVSAEPRRVVNGPCLHRRATNEQSRKLPPQPPRYHRALWRQPAL